MRLYFLLECDFKGQLHVFVTVHWFVEIKVWYVLKKSGVRCWYGAVYEGFSCFYTWYGSCHLTRVLHYISSYSKYCFVGFSFLWFDAADYSSIFNFPILWDLWFWNEEAFFCPETMFPTPCAILPNSLEKDFCQTISRPFWLGVYILVKIKSQDGWQHSSIVLLDRKLHLVWLWKFDCQLLLICSELGIDVVVLQRQLIFWWNLQWHHCCWCGTVFIMEHGFVVPFFHP